MPNSNKPSLVRSRSTSAKVKNESQIVSKGYDTPVVSNEVENVLDPKEKKTRDFNTPLNEYYHTAFAEIAEAIESDFGFKVSRRQLAQKALQDFIDSKLEKYDIEI